MSGVMASRSKFLILAGSLVLLASAGCGESGPPKAAMSGKVTLDGKLLETGVITFIAENGPSAGAEIRNGAFDISKKNGLLVGKHTVRINSNQKTGKQIPVGSPAPPGTMADEMEEVIPAKYNTKTTLSVEVKPGSNHEEFQLTK